MLSLQALGAKHGTDKGDGDHRFGAMTYLDVYATYFEPLRHKTLSILEIGVKDGASLAMWHEYFPWGQIYGIDIDPRCMAHPLPVGRMSIAIGDQGDPAFLAGCFPDVRFDIIVDDGSHVNRLTLASFHGLWPRLKPEGLYCIEDLRCSYDRLQSDHDVLKTWAGMRFNDPRGDYDNDRQAMNDFFLQGIDALDHGLGEIRHIHFWSMLCVMGKV
jgi:hypothetical protein